MLGFYTALPYKLNEEIAGEKTQAYLPLIYIQTILSMFTIQGSTTEIPGPYLSPEQTESFPLKSKDNAGNSDLLRKCCCWPCCRKPHSGGNQGIGGLRPIIACFFTFSLALTVALVLQIRFGEPQVPPHGSVASDSRECSQIGASILKKGGNAVDAAVATTICLGVVLPHLTGIGGGGFLAIYDHRRRMVVDAIDFRETAPQKFGVDSGAIGSSPSGKMVGVPGFLKGLGMAHKLYGRLSWSELITPSINLCSLS
ncbi:hypothetical protein J437_LFUL016402 [Ladona fulva]|uniref:Uncharacterized protein n=1 Tax=Ladona fulva TaxID=123851 RepID=A0A8K0KJN0_LADFU|nr:hypothetical protein J437_LFUL016402 [Ladona fulva]